jgi:hypothetical protein
VDVSQSELVRAFPDEVRVADVAFPEPVDLPIEQIRDRLVLVVVVDDLGRLGLASPSPNCE